MDADPVGWDWPDVVEGAAESACDVEGCTVTVGLALAKVGFCGAVRVPGLIVDCDGLAITLADDVDVGKLWVVVG